MSKNIREININQIKIHDPFWSAMQHRMTDPVIPFQEKVLNDEVPGVEKSHAIENFRIAAGLSEGEFYGMVFQDSAIKICQFCERENWNENTKIPHNVTGRVSG